VHRRFYVVGNRRKQRVTAFFRRLATPLTEAEKPVENREFVRAMNRLYAVALAVTGALFAVMSLPSIEQNSGQSALVAGMSCLLLAALLWRRNRQKKTVNSEPVAVNS
jgi:solute:Na+ symporter, SSS family